jgi:hypothetical protein
MHSHGATLILDQHPLMGGECLMEALHNSAEPRVIFRPAQGEAPLDSIFQSMQPRRIQLKGAQPTVEESDGTSTHEGERSTKPPLKASEDGQQGRLHDDRIRMLHDLRERAIEIEEESPAFSRSEKIVPFDQRPCHRSTP